MIMLLYVCTVANVFLGLKLLQGLLVMQLISMFFDDNLLVNV